MRNVGIICGIGINDVPSESHANGIKTKAYAVWTAMIQRCYGENRRKCNNSYIGCSVCDEWLKFSSFKKFYDRFYVDGYQLDKDILLKGNKIYTPRLCRFVPAIINNLLTVDKMPHAKTPRGVRYDSNKGTFSVRLYGQGTKKFISRTFHNADEAFVHYKQSKEEYIKYIANICFLNKEISKEIRDALIGYEISK